MINKIWILVCLWVATNAYAAKLTWVEQMPIEAYAQLKETERYQMKLAERFYTGEKYEIAAGEFEKYLSLYESSVGAPYAQLMWSHCQLKLRKTNTAISDGFSSVIDYWPDSHEAIVAKYMIGSSYLSMGETSKAEKQLRLMLEEHPKHAVSVRAKVDLVELAKQQDDHDKRIAMLRDLVFNTPRQKETDADTHWASRELASILLYDGAFEESLKSLETSYSHGGLMRYLLEYGTGAVAHLVREDASREKGEKLAQQLLDFVDRGMPEDMAGDEAKAEARSIYYNKARIQSSAGQKEQVRETYEGMIKLFGANDELLGHIAKWYIANGERKKAKALYGRFEDKPQGLGHLAAMHREEKDYDGAILMYQDLMQIDAERANHYQWQIAECYQDSNRLKEAIHSYREADRYPDAYFRMAWCHRKLKQYREALVLYNQARSYETSAPEALLQIGYTYEEDGQREKAIKTFQQTCKTYPKSDKASRAHAHLQNKYNLSVTLGGATDE